ncbi:hypothetical protein [Streptomyces himalayensis]|uniref:Integral membrane protein n=1 Tax=Streptomyces himalayensis subsp. himalayensis TaxID=2756131 RepID=A0A7W0DQR6_9ACTN|nr:hypothetical protein [Streptomyces himalayensis]MBA2949522.1 hypothetical protein [Streptomyces himalayensis subsp. himalayensis]
MIAKLLSERPFSSIGFLLAYPTLALAAALGDPWLFGCAAAVTYAADWRLSEAGTWLFSAVRTARVGLTLRFVVRQLLLVVLLARMDAPVLLAATTFVLFYVLQAPQSLLLTLIKRARRLPVVTRNIDLGPLRIPDTPSPLLTLRGFEKVMHADVPAVAGLLVWVATGSTAAGTVGCAATVTLVIAYDVALLPVFLEARTTPDDKRVLAFADRWLRENRPTVVLYFSGMKSSAYQINMWLRTLEALDARAVVLLRERHILTDLAPTTLPVMCVSNANHVMSLDFGSARVVFYASNVGPNIHMLRIPTARHVFIGHGDSDKQASVNPYAKVYDEVWTAGRAGRDRWAGADVGVRDEDIVEVGRPQLAPVRRAVEEPRTPLTVLYAPTWESWEPEPGVTSLIDSGELIIRALLSAPVEVRILYKPHPYTGVRDPRAKQAHERIVALLQAANAARPASPADPLLTAERMRVEAQWRSAQTPGRAGADEAERARDSLLTAEDAGVLEGLTERRDALFWADHAPEQHIVIDADGPHLYSCFNECDLLVSDISSVVSDFVASGKPYAIVDGAELGEEEFRRRYTAALGAFVLTPDAAGLHDALLVAAGKEPDTMRETRDDVKHYLLGPDEPDAMTRFNRAVQRLAHAAESITALAIPVVPQQPPVEKPSKATSNATQTSGSR